MIAICSRGDWLTRVKRHGRATKCVWNIETERFHLQGFEKRISVTAFADTSFHFSEQKKKSLDKKSVLCDAVIMNFSSIRYLFFKSFFSHCLRERKMTDFRFSLSIVEEFRAKEKRSLFIFKRGQKKKKKIVLSQLKGC